MTSTNTTPESQECPESTLDTFNSQQTKPRTKKCSCGVYALSNCSKIVILVKRYLNKDLTKENEAHNKENPRKNV